MAPSDLMNFTSPCITTLYDIEFSSHRSSTKPQSSLRPSLQGHDSFPAAQFAVSAAFKSPPVQPLLASAQLQSLYSPSADLLVPAVPAAIESNVSSTTVVESAKFLNIKPAPDQPQPHQADKVVSKQGTGTDFVPGVISPLPGSNGRAVSPGDVDLVQQQSTAQSSPVSAERMSKGMPELCGAPDPQQQQQLDIPSPVPASQPDQPGLKGQRLLAAPDSNLQLAIHQHQAARGPEDTSSAAQEPCHSEQLPDEPAFASPSRATCQLAKMSSPAPPKLDLTPEQLERVAVASKVPVSMVRRADQALSSVLQGARLADPIPPSSADSFIAAALQHMLKSVQHKSSRGRRVHAETPASSSSRQLLTARAQEQPSKVMSMASSMPSSVSSKGSSTCTDHGSSAMHTGSTEHHASSTPEGVMQPDICQNAASASMHASSGQGSKAVSMPRNSSHAQQEQQQLHQAEIDRSPKVPALFAVGRSEALASPPVELHQEHPAGPSLAGLEQQLQDENACAEPTQACLPECCTAQAAERCNTEGDEDSQYLLPRRQLTASQNDLPAMAKVQASGGKSHVSPYAANLELSPAARSGAPLLHAGCGGSGTADAMTSASKHVNNQHSPSMPPEPNLPDAVEDNSPRAGTSQEAAANHEWQHIKRSSSLMVQEARSPNSSISAEDVMCQGPQLGAKQAPSVPFDQITASRTQQATAASAVPWGCRAAESSVNEAGAAPTAGPDPVSSQAAQASQMHLEQEERAQATQCTMQPAEEALSAPQDALATLSKADHLHVATSKPLAVSGLLPSVLNPLQQQTCHEVEEVPLQDAYKDPTSMMSSPPDATAEVVRQLMEASSSMDSSTPCVQHLPSNAAADDAVLRSQVPQRAPTFSPGWARRFLDIFRSSEPPAAPASQSSIVLPDPDLPISRSQSLDMPDVSATAQDISDDGALLDIGLQGNSRDLFLADGHVDWEHLPRILVRAAEGSQLNSNDSSPTSQLSWDRMSDMLNESCGEDDQQDVLNHA